MKIVVAIDSYKGCLTSVEANSAAVEGILTKLPEAEVVQVPVSDGGEGWVAAFQTAIGGELVAVSVMDPLMRPRMAQYLVKGETAVIEMAKASGLMLLREEERNPLRATTYGTGQLVADAVRRGCKNLIVGLGGSATNDCGMGMLRALIDIFAKGGSWDDIQELQDVCITIATDVTNPLCGENGATYVFAPQKGATAEMLVELDERARHFADVSARHFGYDRRNMPGAGAAGGLGYAFMQYMGAVCRSGAALLFEAIRIDELLQGASLIVTGEGTADRQTLMGKLPAAILRRGMAHDVQVVLLAGCVKDKRELCAAGFSDVICINPPSLPLHEALNPEVAMRGIRHGVASAVFKKL